VTISPDDEYLHIGVNHIHATNKGYARFSTCLVIDGLPMPWANKAPLDHVGKFDVLTDGNMSYEVVKPLEQFRIQLDSEKYGYDLTWTGRFPVFDYDDCIGGNPLKSAGRFGGHYEQGLHCTGEFEVRAGPRPGRRQIDSYSHRDHSWTDRFRQESPWEYGPYDRQKSLGHFWPSIQTADKHLNAFGYMNLDFTPVYPEQTWVGGFLSDKDGSRPIQGASCLDCRLEDDGRSAMSFRYQFTLPDGEVIHVKTGRKYAQSVNGLMRGENDAECRLDCYEGFFDFEFEETGERGYGCAEYSIQPPFPRWRY
jgi:hypothetical protein